jgi:hypothetical protein
VLWDAHQLHSHYTHLGFWADCRNGDGSTQMTQGADATYFGVNLGPATFNNTLVVELALMGFAEVRLEETPLPPLSHLHLAPSPALPHPTHVEARLRSRRLSV